VRQILTNLIGNAVKFTSEGRVTTSVISDGDDAVFSVSDTGPGISAEDLPRVFEPFTQIDIPGHVKPSGTGLGLSLSQEYAGMLGGAVTAESVVGVGSSFTLRVPLELPPESANAG
jgi:signal transduction histidine kinase